MSINCVYNGDTPPPSGHDVVLPPKRRRCLRAKSAEVALVLTSIPVDPSPERSRVVMLPGDPHEDSAIDLSATELPAR